MPELDRAHRPSGPLKPLALRLVSAGLRLPEWQLERVVEQTRLRDLVRSLAVNCVLDVGANRGQYATDLRAVGYRGQIISFEPVRSEFEALQRAFSHDGLWSGHQVALGSADGTASLIVPEDTVYSSFLSPLSPMPGTTQADVKVLRLDGLLPGLLRRLARPRVFLKMDTQGFDLEVFRGAEGCLPWIVGLQSEISVEPIYAGMPHYLESLHEYEQQGFVLHHLAVVNRTSRQDLLELNCYMRRR
jgi:FkbM family methyltransferase